MRFIRRLPGRVRGGPRVFPPSSVLPLLRRRTLCSSAAAAASTTSSSSDTDELVKNEISKLTASAHMLHHKQRFAEAEIMWNQVLDHVTRRHGESSFEVSVALTNVAHALAAQGQVEVAIDTLRRVLKLRCTLAAGDETHAAPALTRIHLGTLLLQQERRDAHGSVNATGEGVTLLRHGLTVLLQHHDPAAAPSEEDPNARRPAAVPGLEWHVTVATSSNNLAVALRTAQHAEDALTWWTTAARVLRDAAGSGGASSHLLCTILANTGIHLLRTLCDAEGAERVFRELVRERQGVHEHQVELVRPLVRLALAVHAQVVAHNGDRAGGATHALLQKVKAMVDELTQCQAWIDDARDLGVISDTEAHVAMDWKPDLEDNVTYLLSVFREWLQQQEEPFDIKE